MPANKKYVETDKGARGSMIGRPFGPDDSSFPLNDKEARNGRKMGGSVTNVAHSLPGASANQKAK